MRPWNVAYVLCVITLPTLLLGYFPLRRKYELSLRRQILLAVAVSAIQLSLAAVEAIFPVKDLARISISFLAQFALALLAAFLVRQSFFLQVFVIFLSKSYSDNVRLAASAVTSTFFPDGGASPLLIQFLLLAITLPMLYFPLRRFLCSVLDLKPDEALWKNLCVIPVGLFLIFRVAISPDYLWPGTSCAGSPLLLSAFWPLSAFLSFFTVLKTYCVTVENAHLQSKIRHADLVVCVKTGQNNRMKLSAEQTRKEQEQMSDRLEDLRRRLRAGDLPGTRELLTASLGHLDRLSSRRLCENAAVDGVVKRYLHWAQTCGIRMETRLVLPARLPIPEIDFIVVLGNLLENALEACLQQETGDRFLCLRADAAGRDGLMISVRNSYGREPRLRGDDYLSSKRESGPGLGLASVRAVAAKYGGMTRFSHAEGVFESSVLLNTLSVEMEGGRSLDG